MATRTGAGAGSYGGVAASYVRATTVPAGTNRVSYVIWLQGTSGDQVPLGITLGGVAGTKRTTAAIESSASRVPAVWEIINPPEDAQDIVATYANAVYREGRWIVLHCANAHQTAPTVDLRQTEAFAWAGGPYPATLAHVHAGSAAGHLLVGVANVSIYPGAAGRWEDWNGLTFDTVTADEGAGGANYGTALGTAAGGVSAPVRADFVGDFSWNHYYQLVSFSIAPAAAGPTIALTPTSRTFTATENGAVPGVQTVAVTNTGGGVLTPSLGTTSYGVGASGWLSASLVAGTVSLQPNTTALPPGTYTATVPVQAAGATNSPQTITVTYVVGGAPGAWPRAILPRQVSALVSPAPIVVTTHSGRAQRRGHTPGARQWTESFPPFLAASIEGQALLAALEDAWRNGKTLTLVHRHHLAIRGGGTGTPTVNGAGQVGRSLVTQGWAGTNPVLRAGDLIAVAGLPFALTVTADVTHTAGAATVPVTPPILPGNAPAAGAALTLANVAITAHVAAVPVPPEIDADGFCRGLTVTFVEAF